MKINNKIISLIIFRIWEYFPHIILFISLFLLFMISSIKSKDILYLKDQRTNMCFAKTTDGTSVTNVPCTPEVEKLIKK